MQILKILITYYRVPTCYLHTYCQTPEFYIFIKYFPSQIMLSETKFNTKNVYENGSPPQQDLLECSCAPRIVHLFLAKNSREIK